MVQQEEIVKRPPKMTPNQHATRNARAAGWLVTQSQEQDIVKRSRNKRPPKITQQSQSQEEEQEIVKRPRNKRPPKITQQSPSPSPSPSPRPQSTQQWSQEEEQQQSQDQDLQFYQVSKNIRNKERIIEKIRDGYRARRKPCRVEAQDKANLNLFFEQMGIVLSDIPVMSGINKLNVLIPTVVLKKRDEDRRRTLVQNIEIYIDDPSVYVILFFNRNQPGYAEYFEFVTEEFSVEEKKQITYITYVHNAIDASGDRTKSHVGRARAAIGLFMLNHLAPEAMVVITDDRRYLGEPKREKRQGGLQRKEKPIMERVDEIIDYINTIPDTIVSPISQLAFHRDRKVHFVDETYEKTYMMAQIYFGKAGTFSNIYACALMNNAKCEITKKGLKTTPVLASCFARLFEDCAFISAGYDNNFNMVSYTPLARRTPGNISTIARATADFTTLDAPDYNQLMQATESCLAQVRDDTKYIRWGAHIDGIKKIKNKTDPYEYHHACFSARDKKSRKCKDLAAELESLRIDLQQVQVPQVRQSNKERLARILKTVAEEAQARKAKEQIASIQLAKKLQQKAKEQMASIQLAKKLQQQQINNAKTIRKLMQQENELATRNFLKQQQQKQNKERMEKIHKMWKAHQQEMRKRKEKRLQKQSKPKRKASPKKYIIEELRYRETNEDNVKGYRVKWKGYPESENTFEPLSNLEVDVPEMIKEDILNYGVYV